MSLLSALEIGTEISFNTTANGSDIVRIFLTKAAVRDGAAFLQASECIHTWVLSTILSSRRMHR